MKNAMMTLLAGTLVLGCGETVVDQTDPYQTAAYENAVYSADKGDGPVGGTRGKLGLPAKASCPTPAEEAGTENGTEITPGTDTETTPGTDTETTPGTDTETTPDTDTETTPGTETETDPGTETETTPGTETETDSGTETETTPGTETETEPGTETGGDVETPGATEEASADPCAEALAGSAWAPVYDLEKAHVVLGDTLRAPEGYARPRVDKFSMGGSEYWQKWPAGEGPLFGYNSGTEMGRRCMTAAALRFELLLADPPQAMVELRSTTNWSGSFFNWVDDYSHHDSWGDASRGRLWAWRTGLIKFISQTAKDGSCYLPTRSMMESLAEDCLATAQRNDGEIQGCSN